MIKYDENMTEEVEDKISELNKRYFSNKKDEASIMNDLGNCTRRIINVLVVGELMRIAECLYEPNKMTTDEVSNLDGKVSRQTIISYSDPCNFATLYYIYSMLVDSMMLELRKLFYCKKDANSAGTFISELANLKNLQQMNEVHKSKYALFGYTTGFIRKRDIKDGYILFNNKKVVLKDRPVNKNFFIASDDERFILYYDVYSSKAHKLAKEFYSQNYFDDNGKHMFNIADIKQYERYYFHKDEWENNKRWKIHTEVETIQGLPFNHNTYINLCKTNIDNVFNQLEKLVRIMDLYYKSCVSCIPNQDMNIYCNVYGSLPKMVLDICDSFSIEKPKDLHNQIASMIYKKIPNAINAMMLSK